MTINEQDDPKQEDLHDDFKKQGLVLVDELKQIIALGLNDDIPIKDLIKTNDNIKKFRKNGLTILQNLTGVTAPQKDDEGDDNENI
jgi:hypothetical protein